MILRRRSRADRLAEEVRESSPLVVVAVGAGLVAVALGLGYLAKRHFWKGVAIVADAVEEVADTVEDAAEDVRDAARARAE